MSNQENHTTCTREKIENSRYNSRNIQMGEPIFERREKDRRFFSVAFSPDNLFFVSGTDKGAIDIRNIRTGEIEKTLTGHKDGVNCLAFSPNAELLASGSNDTTVCLWDVRSGTLLKTLHDSEWEITSVSFSPDGSTLAFGSNDGIIRLYKLETGKTMPLTYAEGAEVNAIKFSSNGKLLVASYSSWEICVWGVSTGEIISTTMLDDGNALDLSFSPDGTFLVSASPQEGVKLWNTYTLQEVPSPEEFPITSDSSFYTMTSKFSPDGRLLAIAGNNVIALFDAYSLKPILRKKYHSYINNVDFSIDGSSLALGNDNGLLSIINTRGPIQSV